MNCQIFNNNDIFNLIIITESKFILILIIKNVLNINNKELI